MRAAAAIGWARPFVAFAIAAAVSLPAVAGATTSSCEPDASWGALDLEKTTEMFGIVNAHRSSLGLSAFLFSPTLGQSASWKSMHMAEYGYFAHDDPGPPVVRSWQDRLRDCGYFGLGAENISAGSDSALETFQRWLSSPGHRGNIEDPTFAVIGIGVARSDSGTHYWVQNFGSEIDAGASLVPLLPSLDEGASSDAPEAGDGAPSDAPEAGDGAPEAIAPDEAANRDPIALADSTRARRKRWVRISVLRNDSDPDGDALTIDAITVRPSKGRVRIDETRTFIQYRTRRGAGQRVRLVYSITDDRGGFAAAAVRIKIIR